MDHCKFDSTKTGYVSKVGKGVVTLHIRDNTSASIIPQTKATNAPPHNVIDLPLLALQCEFRRFIDFYVYLFAYVVFEQNS